MIGALDLGASVIAVGVRFSNKSANGMELLTALHSLGVRSGVTTISSSVSTSAGQHSHESRRVNTLDSSSTTPHTDSQS